LEHTEFYESAAISFEKKFMNGESRNPKTHLEPDNHALLYMIPKDGPDIRTREG
jgi:hypothetical protein